MRFIIFMLCTGLLLCNVTYVHAQVSPIPSSETANFMNGLQIVFLVENSSVILNESLIGHFAMGTPLNLTATPFQQFKIGITANNVVCKEGFKLVIKTEDGSPACVKPNTAIILVERGWGHLQ